ncbi:MAG: ATP-dependent DNA helicase RecG [Elusimicrobiota bacterium]
MGNTLTQPVKYLKGVGPARSKILARVGIFTVKDLLYYFPKEHDDRRTIKKISELSNGEVTTISGKVEATDVISYGPKLSVFKAAISDNSGVIYASFFKKPNYRYDVFKKLKSDFTRGTKVILHGRAEKNNFVCQIIPEEYELLKNDYSDTIHTGRIVPIYPLTEGLHSRFLRELIKSALDKYVNEITEIIPYKFTTNLKMMSLKKALKQYHFPDNFQLLQEARKRLAFEEFVLHQTAMLLSKKQNKYVLKNRTYKVQGNLLKPFKNALGFEFTQSQKKVINEIFNDMQSPAAMNRLLIGDVGSGKTVVALSSALLAIENGFQVAFMAPTEILAEQHYYTVKNLFKNIDVRYTLLIGSTPVKEKMNILKKLSAGELDIIIGTHALIESRVSFKSLGLIIIDEQHKFGVIQRQKLRGKSSKGSCPDVLVMTATPIPRTLALTVYGDLEVSSITELPPGRKPPKTFYTSEQESYEFVKSEVKGGRQAYIVFPLVEESDKLELKSVMGEVKNLKENVFPDFKVGLLHGQMPGKIKEETMLAFRDKKIEILVATTVIEVGLDIPNATVMVIEHSERFGLASLHQLRGRIGRSTEMDSFCLLSGSPKTEEAKKRIEVMLSTNDGFKIGEMDLKLRGTGQFFGTMQHGLSELKIGDITRDIDIIVRAREVAGKIIESGLEKEFPLKTALLETYAGRIQLSQIG